MNHSVAGLFYRLMRDHGISVAEMEEHIWQTKKINSSTPNIYSRKDLGEEAIRLAKLIEVSKCPPYK